MPCEESCFEIIVKFDAYGDTLPAYRFMRLAAPCEFLKIIFEVDPGYITDNEDDLCIAIAGQKIKCLGKFGFGYKAEYLNIPESGTWQFHLQNGQMIHKNGTIQRPPTMNLNGNSICPDNIILQTVVSKWLGNLDEWDTHLLATSNAGYNMIHFTPLQHRGLSNSPYSLYNHLEFSPDLCVDSKNIEESLHAKLKWMEEKCSLLSMIDVVWNHIACNSPLLKQHPEAGYNLENSPHLRVAYDLDEIILSFSENMTSEYGLCSEINSVEDVKLIMDVFCQHVIPSAALWEYFVIDVSVALHDLETAIRSEAIRSPSASPVIVKSFDKSAILDKIEEAVLFDGSYKRNSHHMDLSSVMSFYGDQVDGFRQMRNERDRSRLLSEILSDYRQKLDEINYTRYQIYDEKIDQIRRNIENRLTYERLSDNGPKLGRLNRQNPLVSTYFTRITSNEGKSVALANNGWIWNADPMKNFADSSSDAYFTREIIVWGDCVKLRYGDKPEDSPWLWSYMTEYTQKMVLLFHAFRIDNCHSTPLHVAEYLLAKAREVRSNLYVCAELFTGSGEKDMIFVSQLGLDSLIREAMVAWDPSELARTVSMYGGTLSGSSEARSKVSNDVHALLMECTHDNEMPSEKRTTSDSLSNAAIVSFSLSAVGSTRGYDDIVPKHINVVKEERKYPEPNYNFGLWKVKEHLNQIHQKISTEGYSSISVRVLFGNVVVLQRWNLVTMRGICLISRTCFSTEAAILNSLSHAIYMDGFQVGKPLLTAKITVLQSEFDIISSRINTIPTKVDIFENEVPPEMASFSNEEIKLEDFPPGSILIFEIYNDSPLSEVELKNLIDSDVAPLMSNLDLYDLNTLLFRCEAEENDQDPPLGTYDLPGYGKLAYSGLQGFKSVIDDYLQNPIRSHPLIENILAGDWIIEYICSRLAKHHESLSIQNLGVKLEGISERIKASTKWSQPNLIFILVNMLYELAVKASIALLSPKIHNEVPLIQRLALTSVQLIGRVKSTGLDPHKNIEPSMSAGLPHFSTHHMRCWGRDVFISLPGLMIKTGRFEDAKRHLIAFASCVYRGLIPNLLDSGRRPRYNARDATWWFLWSLKKYCKQVPKGSEILDENIPLRFPDEEYIDFMDPRIYKSTRSLREIVQSIMQAHVSGIHFREWNAGPALDPVMRDEGFEIDINMDHETGFIRGGNAFNCGTWMDKMGESEKAGNRGIPATPRDGVAVELVALLATTLQWLKEDNPTGVDHVTLNSGEKLTFAGWFNKIESNFEHSFYIPADPSDDKDYQIQNHFMQERGIYKDTFGASNPRCDYQLRPNIIVAMAIAPEIFNENHMKSVLDKAYDLLCGPLGIRTLAPSDPAYHPNYENGNDSEDYAVARGFNYHQGPEWLWPLGMLLTVWDRLVLKNETPSDRRKLLFKRLRPIWAYLEKNPFAGLPELTNEDGLFCRDSCPTQAWSAATLLDLLL